MTRKFRYNPESYLIIQFTIVHMETRLPIHKEKIMLNVFRDMEINENDADVQNVSMESIA